MDANFLERPKKRKWQEQYHTQNFNSKLKTQHSKLS